MKALILILALLPSPDPVEMAGLIVFNLEWQTGDPTARQRSVWDQVARCSGVRTFTAADVQWATADAIVVPGTGQRLYGATVGGVLPFGDAVAIVVDRKFRSNSTVVGHEILHALGFDHSDEEMRRCTPRSDVPLPRRSSN